MTDNQISDMDIQGLAEKLTAFGQTLGPGEWAAFQEVQRQLAIVVAPEEPDVQGYVMLLEMAQAHQSDLRAEAERDRQAYQAQDRAAKQTVDQRSFWTSVITALTRRPQPQLGGATED